MSLNIAVTGRGKPLVFFHGWGYEHRIWRSFIPFLEKDFQLHLVDLPGYGLSPAQSWSDFLANIQYRIPSPFAAIGWSLGGLFATKMALEIPEQVSHLINICSTPCFVRKENWPGIEGSVLQELQLRLIEDSGKTLDDYLSLHQKNGDFNYQCFARPKVETLQSGLTILETWDLRSSLQDIKMPVCYLFGQHDPIISIETMRIMQNHYPKVDCFLLKKSGHIPFLTESLAVAAAIRLHIAK